MMYYLRQFFLLISLLILFSCNKDNSSQKEIIQMQELSNIIYDLHFAYSLVEQDTNQLDKSQYKKACEEEIFDKYKISSSIYNKSIEYYSKDIDSISLLLDMVIKKTE